MSKKLFDRLTPTFQHTDDRGCLTQLVDLGYEQVNVLFTRGGAERGKHYHKLTSEVFYVVNGSVNVVLEKGDNRIEVSFQKGDFFKIYPFVWHQMFFPEDTYLVAMYEKNIVQPNGQKDIFNE